MGKTRFFLSAILFLTVLACLKTECSAQKAELGWQYSANSARELNLIIKDQKETVPLKEFSQWLEIEPKLIFNTEEKAEIENIRYCVIDPILCEITITQKEKLHVRKKSQVSVQKDKIKKFLEDLERKTNKDPVDAKFKIEDGKVSIFSLSQNGLRIDTEKNLEIISEKITDGDPRYREKGEIELAYEIVEPEISSDTINNLGITTLIGEGKSNFRGSPKNRIHNIKVATSRFEGILINPEEEFSFVEILGPVDGEHGYLPELVIKRNKTEPEFGGGICQVSTTMFRAAIYSGMKITARRNHAYPVAYYNPQGMDATVYVPYPDLRFINNTPGHILIQSKIEGMELVFQFYGTDDSRKIEIAGPKIIKRDPDGSMKATFTQKVYDKNENLMINDVFNSSYDSPSKYPHPSSQESSKLTQKPKDWSESEWKEYKKTNGI